MVSDKIDEIWLFIICFYLLNFCQKMKEFLTALSNNEIRAVDIQQ